jgi:hypothetical protein
MALRENDLYSFERQNFYVFRDLPLVVLREPQVL